MKSLNIDFEKYLQHNGQNIFKMVKIQHNGQNIFKMIKTKTNKIVATTKSEILQRIKEWGTNL